MDGTTSRRICKGVTITSGQSNHSGYNTEGIEIAGQQCLILAIDGDLDPPFPARKIYCPSGYHVAGGFRLGTQTFVILCVGADGGADIHSIPSPDPTELLTQRELQIAVLVSSGKVNKQIAYHLRISEYTVSTHLRRIFCKLGVSSRAAMVAQLVAHSPIMTRATSVGSMPRRSGISSGSAISSNSNEYRSEDTRSHSASAARSAGNVA